jgi:hypothetical protein
MYSKRILLAPLLVLASISPIMPSANAGGSCDIQKQVLNETLLKGLPSARAQEAFDDCIRRGGTVGSSQSSPSSSSEQGAWPRTVTYPCAEAAEEMRKNISFFSWHYPTAMEQARAYCDKIKSSGGGSGGSSGGGSGGSSGGSSGGGSGGSSGGSSGGNSGGTKWTCKGQIFNTEAEANAFCNPKTCNSAPNSPSVTYVVNKNSVTFTVKKAEVGEPVKNMYYDFAVFATSWSSWSGWQSINPSEVFTKTFVPLEEMKTRIAFIAFSMNECGASSFVRGDQNNSGIELGIATINKCIAHDSTTISYLESTLESLKTRINSVARNNKNLEKEAATLILQGEEIVSKSTKEICGEVPPKTAALAAQLLLSDSYAKLLAEAKDLEYEVSKFEFKYKVSKPNITITCTKGSITKKVVGTKPKCPTGYKNN